MRLIPVRAVLFLKKLTNAFAEPRFLKKCVGLYILATTVKPQSKHAASK